MKEKLMLFASVLLCVVLNAGIIHSQPKIRIKLIQPPPDNLEANHLWKAEITNLTKDDLTIYLEGTAEESKDGMIVTGTTKQFVIKPGTRTYYYRDFEGGSVSWKNNKYKEILLRTGKAPSGTYTICMSAKLPDGSIAGMENCITHIVNEKANQEIILIQPENGIELNPEEPIVFTWTPPIGAREPCCPFIKIVEIIGNQSPEAAIKNNPAFYSNDNLRTTSFSYPVSAPKFIKGKNYAWQITFNDIKSEVWRFKWKERNDLITLNLINNCTDFENYDLNNSYVSDVGNWRVYNSNGTIHPNRVKIISDPVKGKIISAQDLTGASFLINTADYKGDWSKYCSFCFDLKLISDGGNYTPPLDLKNSIYIFKGLNTNTYLNFTATPHNPQIAFRFILNDSYNENSDWLSICLPLGLIGANDPLPSSSIGYWECYSNSIGSHSSVQEAWNDILTSVDMVGYFIDCTGQNSNEIIGIDNVCLSTDCRKDCCSEFRKSFSTPQLTFNDATGFISLSQNITVGPSQIKKFEAAIIKSTSKVLPSGNAKGVSSYFHSASSTPGAMNITSSQFGDIAVWSGAPQSFSSSNFNAELFVGAGVDLTTPPPDRIKDEVEFCIKYSFTDINCKTCDTVICYKLSDRNFTLTNRPIGKTENKNSLLAGGFKSEIIPPVTWNSFIGGEGEDGCLSVATDVSGFIYVTGGTTNSSGNIDILVAKISPTGNLVFQNTFGGAGKDIGRGIAVDNKGNIYVTGETSSADFSGISNGTQLNNGNPTLNNNDAFLLKLNGNNGNIMFATYWGGKFDDLGTSVDVLNPDDVYITGGTTSYDFPVYISRDTSIHGIGNPMAGNGQDGAAFIVRFNTSNSSLPVIPAGNPMPPATSTNTCVVYQSIFGGVNGEAGHCIRVSNGRIFITGSTFSPAFVMTGNNPLSGTGFPVSSNAYLNMLNGDNVQLNDRKMDAFVMVLDLTLSNPIVYSSLFGGNLVDEGYGIDVDGNDIYFTGSSQSNNFVHPKIGNDNNNSHYDAFICKLSNYTTSSPTVDIQFIGRLTSDDRGNALLFHNGRVFVTGWGWYNASVTSDPLEKFTGTNPPEVGQGDYTMFVSEFDGSNITATPNTYLFKGSGHNLGAGALFEVNRFYFGKGISVDNQGCLILCGSTSSSNFEQPTNITTIQPVFGGDMDGIIVKLCGQTKPNDDCCKNMQIELSGNLESVDNAGNGILNLNLKAGPSKIKNVDIKVKNAYREFSCASSPLNGQSIPITSTFTGSPGNLSSLNLNPIIPFTREIIYSSSVPADLNTSLQLNNINLNLPPLNSECNSDKIHLCFTVSFTDTNCVQCEKDICVDYQRGKPSECKCDFSVQDFFAKCFKSPTNPDYVIFDFPLPVVNNSNCQVTLSISSSPYSVTPSTVIVDPGFNNIPITINNVPASVASFTLTLNMNMPDGPSCSKNIIIQNSCGSGTGNCGCNIGGIVYVNYNNSNDTYPCPCGATINVNSNTLITFSPKNPCSGDSLCFKGSSYQILDSNNRIVGQSQSIIPPLGSFSHNFLLGNYTVKIKSICGNDTCECIINIAAGKSDCDCGRWENNNSGIGYTTKPPIPDINRVPKSKNKQENEDIRKLKIIPDTGIVNSNQNTNSLNCNDTISNFEINTEFRFTSATYLCSSPGCFPQYIWTIKHPAPSTLVQDVNVKSFTTTLSESGIYTLTRKITCGGKICDECVFYVKVGDVNSGHNTGNCNCGGWQREKKITYSDDQRSWTKNIDCFTTDVIGPVKPGLPVSFDAPYMCVPNCPTKYNWFLYNLTTNTIESFANNVSGMPVQFTPSGSLTNYRFVLYPICDGKICDSCGFEFNTLKEQYNDCGRWENNNSGIGYTTKPPIPDINRVPKSNNDNEDMKRLNIIPDTGSVTNILQNKSSVNCNDTISNFEINTEFRFTSATYLCSSSDCTPQYIWSIKHPTPSNIIQDVNTKSFITTFSELGTYSITRKIVCCDKVCNECTFFVRIGERTCECGNWRGNYEFRMQVYPYPTYYAITDFTDLIYGPFGADFISSSNPGLIEIYSLQYECQNWQHCHPKYESKLINLTTNEIESHRDNLGSVFDLYYYTLGCNYKLIIYVKCGGVICDSTGFYFKTVPKSTNDLFKDETLKYAVNYLETFIDRFRLYYSPIFKY